MGEVATTRQKILLTSMLLVIGCMTQLPAVAKSKGGAVMVLPARAKPATMVMKSTKMRAPTNARQPAAVIHSCERTLK